MTATAKSMNIKLQILALMVVFGAFLSLSTATRAEGQAGVPADEPGFTSIFDGKTLQGWDGDARIWRVVNGAIVGEVTPELNLKTNSFLIWRGGTPVTSSSRPSTGSRRRATAASSIEALNCLISAMR